MTELLRASDTNLGVGAECLLSMFRVGREEPESVAEEARALAGAVITSRLAHDVKLIRKSLAGGDDG